MSRERPRAARRRHERVEQRQFHRERGFARLRDAHRQRRQFVGTKTHRRGDRLAMAEGAGALGQQFVGIGGRQFDEIAQHRIVLDLQRSDPGLAAIARFQPSDHAARFIAKRARFIQRGMRAGKNEPAIAREEGRLGDEQLFEPAGQQFDRDQRRRSVQRALASSSPGAGCITSSISPKARRRLRAAFNPSRMAPRSRGPPRPRLIRAVARAISGAAFKTPRASSRRSSAREEERHRIQAAQR